VAMLDTPDTWRTRGVLRCWVMLRCSSNTFISCRQAGRQEDMVRRKVDEGQAGAPGNCRVCVRACS
jgi:hypothetical protein